jgi:hypothetical protein
MAASDGRTVSPTARRGVSLTGAAAQSAAGAWSMARPVGKPSPDTRGMPPTDDSCSRATFTVPVSRSSVLQERRAAVAAARVAAKAASTRGRSHGTLAGYRRGCHKGSLCPTGADGRTCAEVMATYQIDWARRRRAQPGAQEAA